MTFKTMLSKESTLHGSHSKKGIIFTSMQHCTP